MEVCSQLHAPATSLERKQPPLHTHCTADCVEPIASYGDEKNLFPLSRTKPWFLGCLAHSLVTTLIEVSWLLLYIESKINLTFPACWGHKCSVIFIPHFLNNCKYSNQAYNLKPTFVFLKSSAYLSRTGSASRVCHAHHNQLCHLLVWGCCLDNFLSCNWLWGSHKLDHCWIGIACGGRRCL